MSKEQKLNIDEIKNLQSFVWSFGTAWLRLSIQASNIEHINSVQRENIKYVYDTLENMAD